MAAMVEDHNNFLFQDGYKRLLQTDTVTCVSFLKYILVPCTRQSQD